MQIKFLSLFSVLIFVFFWGFITHTYAAENITNILPKNWEQYMTITDMTSHSNILNKSISTYGLNWATYGISYSFNTSLQWEYRDFAWGNICLQTNPVSSASIPNKNITIELKDNSFFWSSKWSYTIQVNSWIRTLKWYNLPAWKYAIRLSKIYDGYWVYDSNAMFYNCN